MTPEQEAALRETVASIIKGEAKLIEQMLRGRARKWLDFVLAEIANESPAAAPKVAAPQAEAVAARMLAQLRRELAAGAEGQEYTAYENGRIAEKERLVSLLAEALAQPAAQGGDGVAKLAEEWMQRCNELREDGCYSCCAGTYEHCANALTAALTAAAPKVGARDEMAEEVWGRMKPMLEEHTKDWPDQPTAAPQAEVGELVALADAIAYYNDMGSTAGRNYARALSGIAARLAQPAAQGGDGVVDAVVAEMSQMVREYATYPEAYQWMREVVAWRNKLAALAPQRSERRE